MQDCASHNPGYANTHVCTTYQSLSHTHTELHILPHSQSHTHAHTHTTIYVCTFYNSLRDTPDSGEGVEQVGGRVAPVIQHLVEGEDVVIDAVVGQVGVFDAAERHGRLGLCQLLWSQDLHDNTKHIRTTRQKTTHLYHIRISKHSGHSSSSTTSQTRRKTLEYFPKHTIQTLHPATLSIFQIRTPSLVIGSKTTQCADPRD